MEFKFLKKNRVIASQLFGQAFEYLVNKYDQSKNILTPASPYTQILHVVSEIGELIFMYIENAISELNILTTRNRDNLYGAARLAGHNPSRSVAAEGKLELSVKPNLDIEISGDYIIIPKYTKLKSLNNNLTYLLKTDGDYLKIEKNSRDVYQVVIIQGELESQIFTAKGTPNESFSVNTKRMTDNNFVFVYVNDEAYTKYDSMYDMRLGDKGVIVKTGINGGLDIYFGTNHFGSLPPQGAKIKVEYLITQGTLGNIGTSNNTNLSWDEPGFDRFGNEIDLLEAINTTVVMSPSLGSNPESMEFTRILAPLASKSFVLAGPDNYVYFLRKYDYFSTVYAYNTFDDEYLDDDDIIYLFLLPDVTKKITSDTNYFLIDEGEFVLTKEEKTKIKAVINESGQQLLSTELRFDDPIVRKYALNIVVRSFESYDQDILRSKLMDDLNNYFLSNKRRDKIPKSDIIAIVEKIEGIDSVNVYFISEANETAIRNGYYYKNIYGYDSVKKMRVLLEKRKINLLENENPNIGLDEFGDIEMGSKDLPLIRGNWYDRNGSFFETYPDDKKLSSVNIFFKGSVKENLFNKLSSNKQIGS